jgi:hypothetical protein
MLALAEWMAHAGKTHLALLQNNEQLVMAQQEFCSRRSMRLLSHEEKRSTKDLGVKKKDRQPTTK